MKKRVVIIGGGISGLATSYRLTELFQGNDHAPEMTLLEANDRLGGSIRTEKKDGFLLEGGSDCFMSDKPWAHQLCERLGLKDELIPTQEAYRRSFVYLHNRLVEVPKGFYLFTPISLRTLVKTPLFSWKGKLRMACEPFIPVRRDPSDESVGSFIQRRLGKEALDHMGQPMLSGIYTADPESLSLRATMPRFLDLEKQYGSLYFGLRKENKLKRTQAAQASGPRYSLFLSLKDGMASLVRRLTDKLVQVQIKTSSSVKAIRKDGLWKIYLHDGAVYEADIVCLAVPAHVASRLLEQTTDKVSCLLAQIPYASVATVNVGFRCHHWSNSLNGSGFVVPAIAKRPIIACTFSNLKFAGRSPDGTMLMRAFVGGALNQKILEYDDEEIGQLVCQELKQILQMSGEALFVKIYRSHKAMPQYHVGHLDRVSEMEEKLKNYAGLFLTGNGYRGIGIPDCVHQAEKTAQAIMRQLQG